MANKLLNYCLQKPYFRLMKNRNDVYWAVKKTAISFLYDTFCDESVLNPEVIREVTDRILALKGKEVVAC